MAAKFGKDKTQFWEAFFPPRNGVKPDFKVGKNFDNEELYYMSKPKVSSYIANKIESYLDNRKYFLIEICSGIGGNTIEFLSRKNCATVMAFEINPKRALYLQRNILGYNLGDKAIVLNREVTGDEIEDFKSYNDSIFYFDPPWLPPDVPDMSNYKKYYIRKDMKVGKKTLEEWLDALSEIAYMVVFRVPDNYVLEEVPGWTYEIENLGFKNAAMKAAAEDGMLFICVNNRKIKGAKPGKFGGVVKSSAGLKMKMEPIDETLAKQYEGFIKYCGNLPFDEAKENAKCKFFVKYGFQDPDKVSGGALDKLPSPKLEAVKVNPGVEIKKKAEPEKEEGIRYTYDGRPVLPPEEQVWKFKDLPKPTPGLKTESPEWLAEFQNYLNVILSKFMKKTDGSVATDKINELLSGDKMDTWIQAFTHDTYDPESTSNYEYLETIGDKLFKHVTVEWLREYFAKSNTPVTANRITKFQNYYNSENFQPLVANSLGFKAWLRKSPYQMANDKIAEDILEAFCGALYLNGEKVGKFRGIYYNELFCKFISQKYTPDPSQEQGDAKSALIQRLEKLGVGVGQATISKEGSSAKPLYTIILSDSAYNALKAIPLEINDKVIATYADVGGKRGEFEAWSLGLAYLNTIGFTNEFANRFKDEQRWGNIKNRDLKLYNKAKTYLAREGKDIADVTFSLTPKEKTGKSIIVGMIYTKEDKVELIAEGSGKDNYSAQVASVNNYIEKVLSR